MKIILISKAEAFKLQSIGYSFGSEGSLHKTLSRHPKYYLTETKKSIADLNKIRQDNVVEFYGRK